MRVQAYGLEDGKPGFYNHRRRMNGEVFDISNQKWTHINAEKQATVKALVAGREDDKKFIKDEIDKLMGMPHDFSHAYMAQVSEDTPLGRLAPGAALPDHMKPVDPYVASEEPLDHGGVTVDMPGESKAL